MAVCQAFCGKSVDAKDVVAHIRSCLACQSIRLMKNSKYGRFGGELESMTPELVIKAMIRKRLMAMNRYTERNVIKVFNRLTDNGKNLEGAVVTNKPEVMELLDEQIKEALSGHG